MATEHESDVDRGALAAAAWLHDIGRPLERTGEIDDHGRWAAEKAGELLEAEGVSADRIDAVEHCLRAHSVRPSSPEPETTEAKLLYDADKLEAVGARGIVRMACIVGERSGRAGEKYAVIDRASASGAAATDLPDVTLLRDWARERLDTLYTEPGRRRGQSRWRFVEAFFAQFDEERALDAER